MSVDTSNSNRLGSIGRCIKAKPVDKHTWCVVVISNNQLPLHCHLDLVEYKLHYQSGAARAVHVRVASGVDVVGRGPGGAVP